MRTQLSSNNEAQLKAYLAGRMSTSALSEWLAACEYDSDLSDTERDVLASLALLASESIEGIRSEDDLTRAIARLVSRPVVAH